MSNYLNTHLLVIDTKFINKNNFNTNTNFVIKSDGVDKKTIKKIKLETIEFPCPKEAPELYHNFENIIKNNNSFIIIINNVEYLISVNNDYYTLITLIAEINKVINNKILNTNYPNETIILSLNNIDYKCYFESSIDIIIEFEKHRINNNSYYSIGKTLGFSYNNYNISADVVYSSEQQASISFDNYFYLSIGNGGSEFSGHIEKIQNYDSNAKLDTTDHTFIIALSNAYDTKYIGRELIFDKPVNLNNILIRLYNSNGNIIHLNNINYTIILEISIYNNQLL